MVSNLSTSHNVLTWHSVHHLAPSHKLWKFGNRMLNLHRIPFFSNFIPTPLDAHFQAGASVSAVNSVETEGSYE